jgi:hypothetical protein
MLGVMQICAHCLRQTLIEKYESDAALSAEFQVLLSQHDAEFNPDRVRLKRPRSDAASSVKVAAKRIKFMDSAIATVTKLDATHPGMHNPYHILHRMHMSLTLLMLCIVLLGS